MGADGTNARAVATCELPCNNMTVPEWRAADPGGIYVGRDEGLGKFMLSRLDLDSGEMVDVVVREDDATAENWRLSPNGKQAAFVRDVLTDAKRAAIFVVDLATGRERQLTAYDYSLDRPDWMPDGRIVFNSPGLGVYNYGDAEAANLWVIDADGGDLAQLTHYTADNSGATQPHVLADGSGIAFTKVLDGTLLRPMGLVDIDGSQRPVPDPEPEPRLAPRHPAAAVGNGLSATGRAGPHNGRARTARRPRARRRPPPASGTSSVRVVGAHPRADLRAGLVLDGVDVQQPITSPSSGSSTVYVKPVRAAKSRCVALEVSPVLVEGHLVRPVAVGVARRRANVVDGRRPGRVVALVVLRPERLEGEARVGKTVRWLEPGRDEGHVRHRRLRVCGAPSGRGSGRAPRVLRRSSARPCRS